MVKRVKRGAGNRTVADLCAAMEAIAPPWTAADWDNVGLLAGDAGAPLRSILLTIDLTPEVLDEAVAKRCGAIVSYHPPVFRAVKRMTVSRATPEGLSAEALARGIAVYSPHTALDAAACGTNEVLAKLAGLSDLRPFAAALRTSRDVKIVVFVPSAECDRVADAMSAAGAGFIGEYSRCSFRLAGEGTFFGGATANPAVGDRGRLERVEEIRLEMVCPVSRLGDAVAAIRASHSYEEPAFDIYPLEQAPRAGVGQGRIGRFKAPIQLGRLASRLAKQVRAACPSLIGRPADMLRRGFVCVGSAGSLPFEAETPCEPGDVVLTGEIRHHDALRYRRAGVAAIALGHWSSERPVLTSLAARLAVAVKGVQIAISTADRDPFVAVQA